VGPREPEHGAAQDPQKYFESKQTGAIADNQGPTSTDPLEALECFHERLAAFKKNGLPESRITPDVAVKVITYPRQVNVVSFSSRISLALNLTVQNPLALIIL
jgi:hypothetical protein